MSLAAFLARIRRARTTAALFAALEEEARPRGLECLAYAALRDHARYGAPAHPAPLVMHSYPDAWIARYVREGHEKADPVLRHCMDIGVPFLWRWLPELKALDVHEMRVLEEARYAELRQGMSVPLIGPAGARAILSYATANDSAEIEPHLGCLGLYAAIFHVAFVELTGVLDSLLPTAPLSPMERACLKWVAKGKTSWETAVILGITESTARSYLRRARRKLRASTLAMAVARAMNLDLLHG